VCGIPLAEDPAGPRRTPALDDSAATWEHRELTVPLNLTVPAGETPAMMLLMIRRQAEDILAEHLEHAGHDGWQPAEPTDIAALWLAGRVALQEGPRRVLGLLAPNSWTFESVTIYVRRPDPTTDPAHPRP
jgi:hypothetical protein